MQWSAQRETGHCLHVPLSPVETLHACALFVPLEQATRSSNRSQLTESDGRRFGKHPASLAPLNWNHGGIGLTYESPDPHTHTNIIILTSP